MARPPWGGADRAAFAVLLFLGATATGGGAWMLAARNGHEYLPVDVLSGTPFTTWTVPGLVLGGCFGLGGLVTAWGVFTGRRLLGLTALWGRPWAWLATLALGVGMLAWLALQLFLMEDRSFLQAVYGAVGLTLTALAFTRLRRFGTSRRDLPLA